MARTFLCTKTEPVVQTKAGKLRGFRLDSTYIFQGVEYAWAERFQPPQPVTPWEGIKDALSYGYVCPLLHQETPNGEVMVPHRYWPMDEHCQNLNIWTQSLDPKAKRPVLVWLHGGGFSAGSAIEHIAYDGENMSRRGDVVVVSVNHRLNLLGYLDLEPFGEKYKNSCNAGNADLVASLRWIRENIESFGGDPDNVTLFGQSGGGMKVAELMQIEEADGLFRKGLIMSGIGSDRLLPACTGDGREIVRALLAELDIKEEEVEKLETVPYYELAKAYLKVSPAIAAKGGYIGGAPLVNDYYKGHPLGYGLRDCAGKIPVMIGSVFGEFSFAPSKFNKTELTETEIEEIVGKVYGDRAKEIRERIPRICCALTGRCASLPKNLQNFWWRPEIRMFICMISRWSFLLCTIRLPGIVRIFRSFSIIPIKWKSAASRTLPKNWKSRFSARL